MKKKITAKGLVQIASICILILVLVGLTVWLLPWITSLTDEGKRAQFQAYIDGLGAKGWFLMLGIQVLQIIVALLPGEPIEILAGVTYGTIGGLLTCLLGILIGSAIIFAAVRKLGKPLVTLFVEESKLQEFRFLKDASRLELVIFILFFIPGTPKDVLTYIAGLTPISPWKFIALATLARIPSVVTSTWAGASLSDGNLGGTVLIFLLTGALGIGGILLNKRLMEKWNR